MFNSLVGTQTPTVQYWDLSKLKSGNSAFVLNLEDDCAPLQYFNVGGSGSAINLYLPINPPNGKMITISNGMGNATSNQTQNISIHDSVNNNKQILLIVGTSQTVTLVYIAQNTGVAAGTVTTFPTGWVSLTGTTLESNVAPGSLVGGNSNYSSVQYGFVGGGLSNACKGGGSYSAVVGGNGNSTSSPYCFIGGGSNNSTSGTNVTVGGGSSNYANGAYSTIAGGYAGSSIGTYATVGGGSYNYANGNYSAVCGGSSNTAAGIYSSIFAGTNATVRGVTGLNTINASSVALTTQGGIQSSLLNLYCQTTTATATTLSSDNAVISTVNQIILPDNSVYYYKGSVIANGQFNATTPITTTGASGTGTTATLTFAAQTAAPFTVGQTITVAGVSPSGYNGTVIVTACTSSSVSYANATTAAQTVAGKITGQGSTSAWTIEGQIKRVVGASQTFLVGTPTVTLISRDANAATWAIAVTADTVNGCLTLTATGVAGQTIQWVARINTTESTY